MLAGKRAGRGVRFLARREVATRLGVSPQTVARWARAGLLPFVLTLGGQRRYPKTEVDALVSRLWERARRGPLEAARRGRPSGSADRRGRSRP